MLLAQWDQLVLLVLLEQAAPLGLRATKVIPGIRALLEQPELLVRVQLAQQAHKALLEQPALLALPVREQPELLAQLD